MSQLSKEPWFGKKRAGIGYRPITWQGWFATLMFLLIVVAMNAMVLINATDVALLEVFNAIFILFFILLILMTK